MNNSDPTGMCYYTSDLKWSHGSWEYKNGYRRKNAPKISNYLFPGYYKIALPNGGLIRFSNGFNRKPASLKHIPATVTEVFFLNKSLITALMIFLSLKNTVSAVRKRGKNLKTMGSAFYRWCLRM